MKGTTELGTVDTQTAVGQLRCLADELESGAYQLEKYVAEYDVVDVAEPDDEWERLRPGEGRVRVRFNR